MNASTGVVVVASYAYDACGVRTVATSDPSAGSDPYAGYGRHYGYYTDWETGLQLCGQRHYDSAAGRWLNRDPISFAGGVNVYEYCGNGPVGMSDASGMWWGISIPDFHGIACWLSLMKTLGAVIGSPCFVGAVCKIVNSCLQVVLATLLATAIAAAFEPAAGCFDCMQNALSSMIGSLIGWLCDYVACGIKPTPCKLLYAIASAALSCVGGLFGESDTDTDTIMKFLLQAVLGLGGNDVCTLQNAIP